MDWILTTDEKIEIALHKHFEQKSWFYLFFWWNKKKAIKNIMDEIKGNGECRSAAVNERLLSTLKCLLEKN